MIVEKDKIFTRLRINKVRKTYGILFIESEKEINDEYKKVYVFTGFESDLEQFVREYEIEENDCKFEELI